MGKNVPSIVYFEDRCAAHSSKNDCYGKLEQHHIFFGKANRKLSDRDGLTCYLCVYHHRNSPGGVHGGNKELDNELKVDAQKAYMEQTGASIEQFRERYGKSWI